MTGSDHSHRQDQWNKGVDSHSGKRRGEQASRAGKICGLLRGVGPGRHRPNRVDEPPPGNNKGGRKHPQSATDEDPTARDMDSPPFLNQKRKPEEDESKKGEADVEREQPTVRIEKAQPRSPRESSAANNKFSRRGRFGSRGFRRAIVAAPVGCNGWFGRVAGVSNLQHNHHNQYLHFLVRRCQAFSV